MLQVEEARRVILENTSMLESETVDISLCLNRVLTEDVYACENIPPFNNSAMDGYAVISSAISSASREKPAVLRVSGKLQAGYAAGEAVGEGTALKIMTGAPIPEGADTVIPLELTEEVGSAVRIFNKATKWENIRFAGEDVKKGQLAIPRGRKLRPAEVGMLAALNKSCVRVSMIPRLAILVTGDEIANPGEELLPGKVRNINSYSLYAQALRHGCRPVNLGVARDTETEIREGIERGLNSDILIISGGVSVGDYDFVKNVLRDMGMEEKFWRVRIKPGKPVLFGVLGKTLVFGLPGNPAASMTAFEQFVLPAVYKLQGIGKKPWREICAILEGSINKKPGMMHFVRGCTHFTKSRLYVRPTDSQSSGAFSSMVIADCFIIVPENVSEIKDGEEVLIQITNEIGD